MKPTNEAPIHLTRKRHSIPCKRDVISSEWSNLKRFKKFKFLLHRIVSGRGWWGSLGRFKLWWPRIRWRHITATTSSVHLVGLDEYETLKRIETNKKNIPSKKEIQTLTGGLWWTALIKSLLSSFHFVRSIPPLVFRCRTVWTLPDELWSPIPIWLSFLNWFWVCRYFRERLLRPSVDGQDWRCALGP